jgi:transposase
LKYNASAVKAVVRQAARNGTPERTWLAGKVARKPRMLVAVALANKTARIVWALMANGEIYRNPVSCGIIQRFIGNLGR